MESVYRFEESFEYNAAHGPRFHGTAPAIPTVPTKKFLGLDVNSRFGISAGPGINSVWTSFYSSFGFDILTYKTVRLVERVAHPAPNWLFLREGNPVEDPVSVQYVSDQQPKNPLFAPTGGSIGTPSAPPQFWQSDIERARNRLAPGQILIVSVMGTAMPGMSREAFVSEYATLSAMVREAGADVIEANLSCPNVVKEEAQVFMDVELSGSIAAALRSGAGDIPILLKVGEMAGDITPFLHTVAPHANGVVMMNAPSRRVMNDAGKPAFGPGRDEAGVHGAVIHDLALSQVTRAMEALRRERIDLEIIGVGGACTPARIAAFIEAGATACLSASAALWNPLLASELKIAYPHI